MRRISGLSARQWERPAGIQQARRKPMQDALRKR
jgi:hypothetical protein